MNTGLCVYLICNCAADSDGKFVPINDTRERNLAKSTLSRNRGYRIACGAVDIERYSRLPEIQTPHLSSRRRDAPLEISGHTSLGNEGVRNWHDGRSSNHFGPPGNGGIAKLPVSCESDAWNRIDAIYSRKVVERAGTSRIGRKYYTYAWQRTSSPGWEKQPCTLGSNITHYIQPPPETHLVHFQRRNSAQTTREKKTNTNLAGRGRQNNFCLWYF